MTLGQTLEGEDVGPGGGAASAAGALSLGRRWSLLRVGVGSGEVEGRPRGTPPVLV